MPDAPDAATFWANIKAGRYSISDVPPERWDPELYYDPDPRAPDKTYSRIGGWVREFGWDPLAWRLPVPPKVAAQIEDGQKWAVAAARSALLDAGWPEWTVDPERVAVIIGNAIGGDKHYRTDLRVEFAEVMHGLCTAPSFAALPEAVRAAVLARDPGVVPGRAAGDHRGHHARRAGQHYRRPDREPVQFPRPQLHHRCRVRIRAGRDVRGGPRTASRSMAMAAVVAALRRRASAQLRLAHVGRHHDDVSPCGAVVGLHADGAAAVNPAHSYPLEQGAMVGHKVGGKGDQQLDGVKLRLIRQAHRSSSVEGQLGVSTHDTGRPWDSATSSSRSADCWPLSVVA